MNYFILRNGQQYGPYSQANLQVYLAAGNISPNDLARAEGMNEWLPLAQVLTPAPAPPPVPAGGPAVAYNGFSAQPPTPAPNGNLYGGYNVQRMPPPSTPTCTGYPAPPGMNTIGTAPLPPGGLHWGLVLLFTALTGGIFGIIWSFVQASWVKKIDRESKAIIYFVIYTVAWVAGQVLNVAGESLIALPAFLVALVFVFIGLFSMRASMERYYNTVEQRGLRLSGVMTFFFGIIYLQYHLNRIVREKRSAQFGQAPPPYQYARPA